MSKEKNSVSTDKKKKMNLLMVIAMGVGSIIGAGIFSITPIAIGMVGPAICWVFIMTAVYVCLRMLPSLVMSSALPANGGEYMHVTRMMPGPWGILLTLKVIMHGTMNIAVMALTCGEYIKLLIPGVNVVIASVITVLIFATIGTFGARITGTAQVITVGVLLVALGVYIFGGIPNISLANITIGEVMAPVFRWGLVWSAMGMLNGTLMGGNSVIAYAEEIDNPGRNVPLAFFISTISVSIFYAIFAYVTIGVVPHDSISNIGEVAQSFLSPAWFTFFIVGGALLAVATTLNGTLPMYAHQIRAAARDGMLPGILNKMNKYNAPFGGMWFVAIIAIVAISSGLNLAEILAIGTCAAMFLGQIGIIPIFLIRRHYPLSLKNCFMNKVPYWLSLVLAILTTYLSFEFGVSLAKRLNTVQWIVMIVFLVLGYALIHGRIIWMKSSKGVDVFAQMKKTYEPWEIREEELRQKV